MESTIKQQISALTRVVEGIEKGSFKGPDVEESQALRDALDNMLALRLINFEQIKYIYTTYSDQHAMGNQDVPKYLSGLESLDLLIDTFRG